MMARFDFDFPKEFDEQIKKLSNIDEIAPKMINAALPIYQNAIKASLSVHNRTGSLQKSVSIKKAKKAKSGAYVGNVVFKGYDEKKTANTIKAAGLEYGNSHQAPKPFLQNAVNSCESKVIEKMQEVFKNEVGGAID